MLTLLKRPTLASQRRAPRLLALAMCLPSLSTAAGSQACAECHRAIYDAYSLTPMAASSGPVGHGLIHETFDRADFTHAPTGFRYRVYPNRDALAFEFTGKDGALHGIKQLPYFIGSGATARSYLLIDDGYAYQAPVAWYTAGKTWDLAPGYDTYAYPYLTRPVVPGCLTCHASFLATVPQAQNRFATPPFGEAGIACERCHGDGAAHIAKMKAGRREGGSAIVNPAKLAPDRRDSICSQCHLSGDARVPRRGKDWRSFVPGGLLWDVTTVFVKSGGSPGITVTGHVEKLAQSACQRASGDRLWCGTCHDPHVLPKPAERAAWFRGKCLTCHKTGDCREVQSARLKAQDDCTGCHMPKTPTVDAQHVVQTDHSIPRRPRTGTAAPRPDAELAAFGGSLASERDLALAYAIMAPREHGSQYRSRAQAMLEKAERESPEDVEVLLYLAELYRNGDQPDLAVPLYQRAMRLSPEQVTASVGLGGIMMERGRYADAIRLWEDALAKNAGLEMVRTNLAMAYWRTGNLRSAESHLVKAVDLSPGFGPAADLLRQLRRQNAGQPGPRKQ
ncbi:MAG TPA: tetratricopeptide repeat protein [Bryobacteraceae bacterium]|nr:tetratricopeptide repeat protein [Bryobacteraceae bacterium]